MICDIICSISLLDILSCYKDIELLDLFTLYIKGKAPDDTTKSNDMLNIATFEAKQSRAISEHPPKGCDTMKGKVLKAAH